MFALLLACLFLVDPFWVAKPPQDWTDAELTKFLTDSPWAHYAEAPKSSAQVQPLLTFLATAAPMLRAEEERERRGRVRRAAAKQPEPDDPLADEYRLWLEDNRPSQLVLAIRISNLKAFADEKDVQRMEKECVMRAGRTKVSMSGHFPPSTSDPYLRMAFPRNQVKLDEKNLQFDLYIPGVAIPLRQVEFVMKDLSVDGRPEF